VSDKKQTFNERFNKDYLLSRDGLVDNEHDCKWLCNQMASLYQKNDDGCIDNMRVDKAINGDGKTDGYIRAMQNGCCNRVDKLVVNPITGSAYWIGLNNGH